ncbi:MAG: GDP-mannose 4,6-dehydratase [Gemmatimonadota bacterium]|nr:GDP-mannose 4,6-dehydratase [Gemmatimonadota bacterium]MDQ8146759.1 GDP-mannose 4,6-dehydratase [Gemmatimonadota bacterium]MDQ8148909.1 GDP-mannose 4,6-dehydratase [Gemmatimonadota bacterium]MDQ8157346.1 GDP-mannose 4,6-dehydratase [Gemmatimonadota bacterium]MDQ8176112.1 GDP-mannose 4,6-dehydratase [Gemmatimonadota bacterium]
MTRALVTGAEGFVGQWLVKALLADGVAVTATTATVPPSPGTLTAAEVAAVRWVPGDLAASRDLAAMHQLLDVARPDAIYHLAGISYVPAVGDDPVAALGINVGIGVRLIEAAREWRDQAGGDPAILVIGSAEEYGRQPEAAGRIGEHAELLPRTFYGATKCSQEHFALAAARTYGMRIMATRSFNHCGPGHASVFLLPALVQRVLRCRAEGSDRIVVGNLGSVRDYLHVADVVDAYRALAASGAAGEAYNVCSGEGVSVADLAREVLEEAGVTARVESDAALQRPVDVPYLVGDNAKLRARTGWAPRRGRRDIIRDHLYAAS